MEKDKLVWIYWLRCGTCWEYDVDDYFSCDVERSEEVFATRELAEASAIDEIGDACFHYALGQLNPETGDFSSSGWNL